METDNDFRARGSPCAQLNESFSRGNHLDRMFGDDGGEDAHLIAISPQALAEQRGDPQALRSSLIEINAPIAIDLNVEVTHPRLFRASRSEAESVSRKNLVSACCCRIEEGYSVGDRTLDAVADGGSLRSVRRRDNDGCEI